MNKNLFTYKKSGVNIDAAERFVNFIANISSKKRGNKKFNNIGGFGSVSNLPKNIKITHQSLFDNSIEGIQLKNKPVFSVQYHPESNPGPQDSVYLFQQFIMSMKKNAKKKRY